MEIKKPVNFTRLCVSLFPCARAQDGRRQLATPRKGTP
jgi:hypothetical protein